MIPACCKNCECIDYVATRLCPGGYTTQCTQCSGPHGDGSTRNESIEAYNVSQRARRETVRWDGQPKQHTGGKP